MTDQVFVPWIGYIHVRPKPGSEPLGPGARGAYTHILALAENQSNYVAMVEKEMEELELDIIDLTDIKTADEYRKEDNLNGELGELCSALTSDNPVQYKTFFTYYQDDS